MRSVLDKTGEIWVGVRGYALPVGRPRLKNHAGKRPEPVPDFASARGSEPPEKRHPSIGGPVMTPVIAMTLFYALVILVTVFTG